MTGTPVVVKLLRNEHPTPLQLARLRHEHEVLAGIDDPHIVKSRGLLQHGHGLALVLEDVGENSLDHVIASGTADLGRRLELAVSLARTVAAVHRHRVIHKDIKPHHFFIRNDAPDTTALIDFGLATSLAQRVQAAAKVTELEGTLAYIAPEQTGRMNRVVDWRSDLYSLGVTLYELFTERLPFDTKDPLELVHSHIARNPTAPAKIRTGLPAPLSDIILRLLAKSAEDRYQSAVGVQRDLERCLELVRSNQQSQAFVLGADDDSGEFAIPQKLYGRERELARLGELLAHTREGEKGLVLLRGTAGVGKSALVHELRRSLVADGYFVTGKFDFLGTSVPYAPLGHAFRELVQSVLAEPPAVLEQRKRALLDAVGPNGRLLIELVPELEWVIGPQPEVAALGPGESQDRFELLFVEFLRAFASRQHPLILFLDDLQWADAGSLRLLQHALSASGLEGLLVLGAYRDNEVSPAHPLSLMLDELAKAGASIHQLQLEPLALDHVASLLCDTLHCSANAADEFATILLEKTLGNPFFVNQFLITVHRDGLLTYAPESRVWQWDLAQIRSRLATDNVVDFMMERLRELPSETQAMLHIAACIGHEFDDQTLATVSQRSRNTVMEQLWSAVQQGFLVPLDSNYRYAEETNGTSDSQGSAALNAAYRYLHDRVHQAAYTLLDEDRRAEMHVKIGRFLLARAGGKPADRELFEITDHLNRGRKLIDTPEEILALARLNLSAALKARNGSAPEVAVRYVDCALDLLGESSFESHFELAWPAHMLKAECSFLVGNLDEAMRITDVMERHAQTTLQKVDACNLHIALLTKSGRLPEACEKTAATLAIQDWALPPLGDPAALGGRIGAEFGAYQGCMGGRSVESLAELPSLESPQKLALLETLAHGVPAAFGSKPELHVLLVLKGVQVLSEGKAPLGGFFYEQYAIVHSVITGDLEAAYRYGKLGLTLAKNVENPAYAGQVYFLFGGFTSHWRDPISVGLKLLRQGLRQSLEAGDRIYACYCSSVTASYRLYSGECLADVEQSLRAGIELAERFGDVVNTAFCKCCERAIAALRGQTTQFGSLDGADFSEADFEASAPISAQPFYGTVKAMIRYLAGKYADAVQAADQWPLPPGMFFHGEHALYRTLATAELAAVAGPDGRERYLERIRKELVLIEGWAKSSPENHAHRAALVRARLAELEGDQLTAMRGYDEAIGLAEDSGCLHHEALANELAARFHIRHGRPRVARAYVADCVYAYERWGATVKVEQIRREHSDLLPTQQQTTQLDSVSVHTARLSSSTSRAPTTLGSAGHLDLATAVRATEAIATELLQARLMERLMRALVEHAGAQRGCLVMSRNDRLELEATVTIDPDVVRLDLAESIADTPEVPASLVRYVARTHESVVLDNATRDSRFGSDPYMQSNRPKSALCIAMMQRGKLTGVLYLENTVTTSAFNPNRTALLEFLATQAAVAFENARLYGDLAATTEALRRTNESLEVQVADRTAELRRTLAELWSEMDLARKIQTVLLPKSTHLPGYDIAAVMHPADSVGGDYYDVIQTDRSGWILIGDVSGHGVSAGLVMMMVQVAVRTVILTARAEQQPLSPAMVLAHVNRAVRQNLALMGQDQYMTITALEFDGNRVTYAGLHQDILVHRAATDSMERLESKGIWLGFEDEISGLLENETVTLEPGDSILLYTDGVTESVVDGRMLETPGLARRFQALASQGLPPAGVVERVLAPIGTKDLRDDVTALVARYTGEMV